MTSDVVIVLKRLADTAPMIEEIFALNGSIREVYSDLGVIEATLAAEHVHPLHKHESVSYIRPTLTFEPCGA